MGEYGCIDIDGCVHLGEVFQGFSQEEFLVAKGGVLCLVAAAVDGGIRESVLNPVLSLASANDLESCVWSIPCTSRPLLSILRLLGQRTYQEMKSRLEEMTWRMLLMVLERLEI